MRLALALVTLLSLAAPAAAQYARVDVDRLPIDVQRIKRQLRPATVREERDGLNLRYHINIYGLAPPIQIVPKDDPRSYFVGPVPYGAPTHKEFLDFWTPQPFRSPAADLTTFIQWLADRAAKKSKSSDQPR